MSLKDAPSKIQFLHTIKKVASTNPWRQNANWRKSITVSTVTEPKYVRIPILCIFQELMNRGRYAYVGLFVNYAWGKSSCVSKIPQVLTKKKRKPVSVFLSTLQLSALLLKSFRLRLHCYTLLIDRQGWNR